MINNKICRQKMPIILNSDMQDTAGEAGTNS